MTVLSESLSGVPAGAILLCPSMAFEKTDWEQDRK
jgi:hypothetical protein